MMEADVPDDIAFPDDLGALTRDQLTALERALHERATALRDGDGGTEELAAIAAQLPQVGQRIDELDQAVTARADAIAALDGYTARPGTAPAPVATPPAVEPDPAGAVEVAPEATPDPAPALAASVSDIAQRAPRPVVTSDQARAGEWWRSLTAAVDMPDGGPAAGAPFQTLDSLTRAMFERSQVLTRGGNRQTADTLLASAHVTGLERYAISNRDSAERATEIMGDAIEGFISRRAAKDDMRSALTAAGFCTPSIIDYTIPALESTDGFLELPEIGINRGGIRYYRSPEVSAFTAHTWEFTEAELIDDPTPTKPCPVIACPTPIEQRAMVKGACIQADIVTNWSFPELTRRFVRGVGVAHALNVHLNSLAAMITGSTAIDYTAGTADEVAVGRGATAALLFTLEIAAEDMRADSLLPYDMTPNVALPRWVRTAIRADLASRSGVELLQITNDYIDDLFRARGLRPQWLQGWQTAVFGAAGAAIGLPASVQALIWYDGTWVRGLESIINISAHYDSTLFLQNRYIEWFTESAFMMVNPVLTSRLLTVPLCADGATRAPVTTILCGAPGAS